MTYLDHNEVNEVIAAISSKMDRLLEGQRGPMREDAPSLKTLSIDLKDPDEPGGN